MNEDRAVKREQAKQKLLEGKKNRTKKEKKIAKIKVDCIYLEYCKRMG